ncbi:hypothetical protein HYT92_00460 [Candidatus Pacearchaeota archaeon]|nr:hypothetical protein [Candidatus Pacearchaeota archaeon]
MTKDIDKAIEKLKRIDLEIDNQEKKMKSNSILLEKLRHSKIILFFLGNRSIDREIVTDVYESYRNLIKKPVENLDVIVHSGGGDIDATFHLVNLFRKMAYQKLTYIVPRWAKSAATCLVCGGDYLILGESSELGPIDPQISIVKGGIEEYEFSPLSIKITLKFLADLLNEGEENKEIVKQLLDKIHPLSLGEHVRSLIIAPTYLENILKTRMLKGVKDDKIKEITRILSEGYPHHGYCILKDDIVKLELKVEKISEREWELIWAIWKSFDIIKQLKIEKSRLMSKFSLIED